MTSLLDDMLKGDFLKSGNLLKSGDLVIGVAAAALTLPIVFPPLRAPMLAVLKTGIALFVEAEFEVEGEAIETLADGTVDAVFAALSGSGRQEERHRAAHDAIRVFTQDARRRAHRWGHDERDRAKRYRRHVAALRRKMARLKEEGPEEHRAAIGHLADAIVEDW
jgi:hypothetical protein